MPACLGLFGEDGGKQSFPLRRRPSDDGEKFEKS
jgi:hypothetical protein